MPKIPVDEFLEPGAGSSPQGPTLQVTREVDTTAAVRRLPPLPAVLQELLRELRNVDADIGSLEERISSDPSLTTRVLKMANSPFYNSRAEVVSVGRAVMILGFKTVSNLIMASGFRGAMTVKGNLPGFEHNGIFRHSLGVGICCNRLGQRLVALRDHRDELFVAGLLHDVGRIALSSFYQDRAADLTLPAGRGLDRQVEFDAFGVDHPAVGEMVIDHWGLPHELIAPVTRHHDDPDTLRDEPTTLAVSLCDQLLNLAGFGLASPHGSEEKRDAILALLDTDLETVEKAVEGYEDEVASILGAA
ncbi:MAG: HDOD domain-containing protein [Gemmatimonadetes bacterium]|nr:HDOD domain-containing protein [Gemmatimonadota bacterium]